MKRLLLRWLCRHGFIEHRYYLQLTSYSVKDSPSLEEIHRMCERCTR